MIPYGRQDINEEDISAVVEVLKSDYLTQGPKVPEFERAIASFCHAKYSFATNSATSALHIACLALGVKQGDSVWTSPISFVASSNCALYCGATVDFIDIDINTGNICINALAMKLDQAQSNGSLPKVIICVHLAGQSCDMETIKDLTKKYNIAIIEDASHAIGASYMQKPVGCGQFSDITVFSFHPVKIVTSAEGGMALTNCPKLAKQIRLFRSHGITTDPGEMNQESHGPWYYQQIELGYNYRMTELQAALGLSQLQRLSSFIEQRNTLAKYYDNALKGSSLTPLIPNKTNLSAYHLYIVLLPSIACKQEQKVIHKNIVCELRARSIFAQIHYIPIHLQPYYQNLGFNEGSFPNAENYYSRTLSIPLYPKLSKKEQNYIINTLLDVVEKKGFKPVPTKLGA
ncbi:MAG: UDP-4-amino-4,6-dideoxy-N-acetyl-beta-L-altrosamine transaminase [Colwelliaceae bacterium]|nr:UDP-4-amino-4,6-dideoxy-N-acetyl-beta-L-altrosamine transaminase [Colwelliaceae bacterium]